MRIVAAPDKFKESLTASEAAEAIAAGVHDARPDFEVDCAPMADGGEGTVAALVAATGGRCEETQVSGPLSKPVRATWGMLGGSEATAIVEMAAASGLALIPSSQRDPTRTSTFGSGELIRHILEQGTRRLLIGIGGSATNDGGAGAAQAIGIRFYDAENREIREPLSGGRLDQIARIERAGSAALLDGVQIEVACDVTNPLCGPSGAAAVYGPQKGATPGQVEQLDRNLAHLAEIIERDLGVAVRDLPGAGAAGGFGAGLVAFFGADLRRGIDLVMDAVNLRERIRGADLVITGEGRLDAQSAMGKVISGVGQAARDAGVPVIALVGRIGPGAEAVRAFLDGYRAITPETLPAAEALARAGALLRQSAADLVRGRYPV